MNKCKSPILDKIEVVEMDEVGLLVLLDIAWLSESNTLTSLLALLSLLSLHGAFTETPFVFGLDTLITSVVLLAEVCD